MLLQIKNSLSPWEGVPLTGRVYAAIIVDSNVLAVSNFGDFKSREKESVISSLYPPARLKNLVIGKDTSRIRCVEEVLASVDNRYYCTAGKLDRVR